MSDTAKPRFELLSDINPSHNRVLAIKSNDHLAFRDGLITFEGACCSELATAFKILLFGSTDEVIATAFKLRGTKETGK